MRVKTTTKPVQDQQHSMISISIYIYTGGLYLPQKSLHNVVRGAGLLPNGQHFWQVQIKNICFIHKTHQIAKLQKKCMVAVGLEPASPQLSARHSSTEPH